MTEEGRLEKPRWIQIATWSALAVVLVIQALPFTYGYRRSADDAMFLDALAGGWAGVERLALIISVQQGRLGLIPAIPLNTLGAYLADSYWARSAFVLMHFGVFVLFAAYVSRLLAANVQYPLLILLFTLQTVGGVHDYMPPISYPVQNTVPLLMLFAARLTLLKADSQGRTGGLAVWVARLAFLIVLIVTEYTFLVGTAALACEYLARWARQPRVTAASARTKLLGLIDRQLLWDASLVAIALVSYLAYRFVFPSSYTGNVIDGAGSPWRVIVTTVRHVQAGTIFVRDLLDIASIPQQALVLALVVGVLTALSSYFLLCQARAVRTPLTVLAVCIVAMAYVTFPLAGNVRQQMWCLDHGTCGYLDSRISYLGFGLILLCLVALALKSMPTRRAARVTIAVLSGVLGVLSGTGYAYNLRDGLTYATDARAWQRANLLACHADLQSPLGHRLVRMIDPDARVRFHPGTDQAHFWRNYLALKSRNQTCSLDDARRQADRRLLNDSEPILPISQTVRFSQPLAARYLGKGWSAVETAGVWTDGPRAELVFIPGRGEEAKPLVLKVGFNAYVRPNLSDQAIEILVDGRRIDTWTITRAMNDGRTHERTIDLGRRSMEETEIVFHVLDPRQPATDREISDSRHLGMFLRWMVLEAQTP